jgi:hypothetical protein
MAATTGPARFVALGTLSNTLSGTATMENRQQTFPAVPPSFSAGDHEMRDYYADSSAPRPNTNSSPYLTPYLGLRARLSQVWINRWTVLLLLVLVRVVIAIGSADDLIDDARTEALSACTVVEKAGSTLASVPHYASQGFNAMTARGVESAVSALQSMVTMTLTGIEEMVVFYIGMLTNTYLCLITLAVSGSLHAVVDILSNAQAQIDASIKDVSNDITSTASKLQSGIQLLTKGINTVLPDGAPKVDFSGPLQKLSNIKIPDSVDDSLKKLNSSIPTFEQVKNVTDTVIRTPFEEVKKLINNSWGNYTFNHSLLPVPQKEEMQFCSDNEHINGFFGTLRNIARKAKRAFIGVLLTLAILACIPMALLEMRRYKRLQERPKLIGPYASDEMDRIYLYSRPYTSDIGLWVSKRFSSTRSQHLARWCVAYFTSIPALFLLSLGIAGLFSCFCQYIFLKQIEKDVPALAAEVAGFTADVVGKLNNASASWATKTNAIIGQESGDLNKELLGWVNTSTVALNDTLNRFVDETITVLNTTFGGTPLFDPIKEVFNCLIGIKVAGISKGLTWVHDNAHINFPQLSNDSLTGAALLSKSSPEAKAFFADPKNVTQNDVTRAITKVGDKIAKGIRQEALISTVILIAWLVLFLGGITVTFIRLKQREKLRAEAGHTYDARDHGLAVNLDQHLGPAPAYYTHQDVNSNAPYTLNPHPIPRQSSDSDDVIEIEKRAATNIHGTWTPKSNQNQNQYNNEKANGFL